MSARVNGSPSARLRAIVLLEGVEGLGRRDVVAIVRGPSGVASKLCRGGKIITTNIKLTELLLK
jgi:hypothetical protein